jgi:beta-fructofuranosidase
MHRDHFVFKKDDGEYLMYVSGIKNRRGCISVASSWDLIHWEFRGYALTSDENAPLTPAWGAMESPFIVEKDGYYYLFVTYTDSGAKTYNDTLVFASKDPLHFGSYMAEHDPAIPITTLYAHAPEILHENGKYYITTCGWLKRPTPNPGCVSIAELIWE